MAGIGDELLLFFAGLHHRIDGAERGKKGPVLRTVNCCEGLTQQQADKLFDRFYRVDQSRTTGGFGIGLSMARSIAEGHKGSIKATCREDGEIEFTVSLGKCV